MSSVFRTNLGAARVVKQLSSHSATRSYLQRSPALSQVRFLLRLGLMASGQVFERLKVD
jgi:hypothetical protein